VPQIPTPELRQLIKTLLLAYDCDSAQAEILSRVLSWNSQINRPTQGAWRLPVLINRLQKGRITTPCQLNFEQKSPAMGLMDGNNGFGQYVSHHSMLKAIELAKSQGVGVVGVRNSNWNGSGAYYTQLAAEQGMIGISTSNSVPKVAPFGGTQAVFGTNPMAFGVPRRDGRSILLDMATAASAGSSIKRAIETGEQLPEGIAVDANGQPITDPNEVKNGTVLPFGGAKGYGLSLMVEILSAVITGAGISHQVASMHDDFERNSNNGHLFIALDVSRFMPLDQYYQRLEQLSELIHDAGGKTNNIPSLPGESRWQAYDKSQREGITLDEHTRNALQTLAKNRNIPLPW